MGNSCLKLSYSSRILRLIRMTDIENKWEGHVVNFILIFHNYIVVCFMHHPSKIYTTKILKSLNYRYLNLHIYSKSWIMSLYIMSLHARNIFMYKLF